MDLQKTMTLASQSRITRGVERLFPCEAVEDTFAALRQGHPLGRRVLAI